VLTFEAVTRLIAVTASGIFSLFVGATSQRADAIVHAIIKHNILNETCFHKVPHLIIYFGWKFHCI
jgi:hypothetical protein